MLNYDDYRTYILTCEFLGKEPTGKYKRIHDFLTEMWDGLEMMVVNSITNPIVFQKGGNWYFEQDLKFGYLLCNYERVWSFFVIDIRMGYIEALNFIKMVVEEHLKCEVGTPEEYPEYDAGQVEEHLKCEVGTPFLNYMEDEL